jgi:CspA family cold shock protein
LQVLVVTPDHHAQVPSSVAFADREETATHTSPGIARPAPCPQQLPTNRLGVAGESPATTAALVPHNAAIAPSGRPVSAGRSRAHACDSTTSVIVPAVRDRPPAPRLRSHIPDRAAGAVLTESRQPMKGTIKFYSDDRGFGFIAREGADDVFVHRTNVAGDAASSLSPGQAVEFEIAAGRKGDEAVNVRPA